MILTPHNQLQLLYDILSEQKEDGLDDIAEYTQIKRLVKTLMTNDNITNQYLLELLPEIYNYGRQGEIAQNDKEHILSNEENINKWIQAISQTSPE